MNITAIRERMKTLQAAWETLGRPDRTLLVALLLVAIGVGLGGGLWLRNGQLEARGAAVERLEQRLLARDQEISKLYTRLMDEKASGSAYGRLSNRDLKHDSLAVVGRIRGLLERYGHSNELLLITQQESETATKELWEKLTAKDLQQLDEIRQDFHRDFKIEANLLREELLLRLPANSRNKMVDRDFKFATNYWGIVRIADDLEQLALNLPVAAASH